MSKEKRFIAFDLGLNFGYYDGEVSGCIRVSNKKRMFSFYDTILNMLVSGRSGSPYKAIVFEDAKFQKGNAIYNFNAQKGILQLLAESLNIEFIGYPPMTVKKAFCGSGRATKEDMLAKATEITGNKIKNHNEADAIGVYHTHLKEIK